MFAQTSSRFRWTIINRSTVIQICFLKDIYVMALILHFFCFMFELSHIGADIRINIFASLPVTGSDPAEAFRWSFMKLDKSCLVLIYDSSVSSPRIQWQKRPRTYILGSSRRSVRRVVRPPSARLTSLLRWAEHSPWYRLSEVIGTLWRWWVSDFQ